MLAALANTELIATIAVSLSAALGFGVVARKLRVSPIVGYMLAGILVGPHTPGFVANQQLADQLAEIGIALLMFGVGLHFSLDDLLAVRRVAVPGALGQSAFATVFGIGVALACGWDWSAGLVFGMALSVASTVVLIRGLTDCRQLDSVHGHVAVGWLVVEDLLTVLMLIALPTLAGGGEGANEASVWTAIGTTALKLVGLGLLYVVGTRVVPWFLEHVARLQSRELFTLAVLGIALGVAYGSAVAFSVSMALGAFLGGMIVGRSELSHQAAADALPLRDAFAVLFFVSVGMLFDPAFVVHRPLLVLGALAIILVVKPVTAFVITLMVGYPIRTGITVAAGLAQIGEFSFIVAGLGRSLGLLPDDGFQAIVVAALASIAVNPLAFALVEPMERALRRRPSLSRWVADQSGELARVDTNGHSVDLTGHAIVCGCGRTGRILVRVLRERRWPLLVIDQDRATVQQLRRDGITAIHGDAANPFVLERASLATARLLVVTLADPLATRQIVEHVRRHAPDLQIVARVQSEAERHALARLGHAEGMLAEQELAIEMAANVLQRFGTSQLEAQAIAHDLRRGVFTPRSGARVLEVRITAESKAAGRHLAELALGQGILVMAIDRDGELLVPDGTTKLEPGDLVMLVSNTELTEHAKGLL